MRLHICVIAGILFSLGCSETTGTLDPVEACEDEALDCLDVVDGGGEEIDYLRGEFCGCLGQACLLVIRNARRDGLVAPDIEKVMDVAHCVRHKE
jgi:hypothetical protein